MSKKRPFFGIKTEVNWGEIKVRYIDKHFGYFKFTKKRIFNVKWFKSKWLKKTLILIILKENFVF